MKKITSLRGIKFLNKIFCNIKHSFNKLKTFYDRLQQSPNINIEKDLVVWVCDVVQYGFVALIDYLLIRYLGFLGLSLGFGISLWLLKQIIINIKEALN